MPSLPVFAALLQPASSAEGSTWLPLWMSQPGFLYPVAFGLLMLLGVVLIKADLPGLPSRLRSRGKSTLDPGQLEELMLGTPPNILDLRGEPEFRGRHGHIRSAVNIPFPQLEARLDELDTSHPRPIVLVDETDVLSHQALPLVTARGHSWVYVLRGGMKAWRRAKLPTYPYLGKPEMRTPHPRR